MRLFFTELKKIRHRYIWLVYGAAFTVIFLWLGWCVVDMDSYGIAGQEYFYLLLSLSLMNSIFLPIALACAASRLCDIELKGYTFKLLCTMQPRHSIYHIKLFVNCLYLLAFSLAETALVPLLGHSLKASQPLPAPHICIFFFTTFIVSLVLYILQQSLSLVSGNQLFPLFLGVGGTFIGIFSAFFPSQAFFFRLLPWCYYMIGCPINMYYESSTRETTYFEIPFPTGAFLGFLLFGIILYFLGKTIFMKKEV